MSEQVAWMTVLGAVGTALLGLARWAVKLWADVRRETIVAADKRQTAELDDTRRRDAVTSTMNERLIQTLLDQTRSNAALEHSIGVLGGKVDQLAQRIDDLEFRHTPPAFDVPPTPATYPHPVVDRPSTGHRMPTDRDRERTEVKHLGAPRRRPGEY